MRPRPVRSYWISLELLVCGDRRALSGLIQQLLRDGVKEIAVDLSLAGELEPVDLEAIKNLFATVQSFYAPGPRAGVVLLDVSAAQLVQLKAARITSCVPVRMRADSQLTFGKWP